MAFLSSLFGEPARLREFNKFTPQQLGVQGRALQQFGPTLANVAQPTDVSGIASNVRRRFNTETVPALAERFTAGFGSSPYRSSNFKGALGGAAAGLESQLGALENQTAMQDKNRNLQLLNLLGRIGLEPTVERMYTGGSQGYLPQPTSLLGSLVHGIGSYFGSDSSPLPGLGSGLSGLFGGRSEPKQQSGFNNQSFQNLSDEDKSKLMQLLQLLQQQQLPY
jgi:hypothetical protein